MKALWSTLLVLAVASFTLQAQDYEGDKEALGKSDPEAKKLLKQLSKEYKGFDNFHAEFTLTITVPSKDEPHDELDGSIYIKGDKYRLDMQKQKIINNGKTIWTYLKDANEVQVNHFRPDTGKNSLQPTDIFTIYDSDFLSAVVDEETDNGQTIKYIDMTPYDKDKSFFKIRLKINADTKRIESAKIFDKNGNRYIYTIDKLEPNVDLSKNFFTFDKSKHKGVNVIDMR